MATFCPWEQSASIKMKTHSYRANDDTIAAKIPIFQRVQAKEQQDISFASRETSTSALSTSIALNNSPGKFIIGLGTPFQKELSRETCSTVESFFFSRKALSCRGKKTISFCTRVYRKMIYEERDLARVKCNTRYIPWKYALYSDGNISLIRVSRVSHFVCDSV